MARIEDKLETCYAFVKPHLTKVLPWLAGIFFYFATATYSQEHLLAYRNKKVKDKNYF